MKSKLAFVRQPDSIPRKTAFSLRYSAAILLQLSPKTEAHGTPFQGGEHNRIRFQTVHKSNLAGRSFCLEVMPIPCPHFKITIPRLELNGKTMLTSHGCSVVFNPCLPDGMINEAEAKWALEHYDLDTSYGWMIFRAAFPWTSKRRPEIKSLSLTMEQRPCRVPGPHFQTHAPGDSFSFLHPVSGTNYTLTVQEIEQQTIPQKCFGSDRWVYPTHFTVMRYTLFPESEEDISICDCCDGDKPMEIAVEGDTFTPETQNNACVGIIGGADGPTVIMPGEKSQGRLHAACSALHFEPVRDDVEWCTMFSIKNFDETTINLI